MNGITRKPAFWIAFAVALRGRGRLRVALLPAGAAADQSRRQDVARRGAGRAPPRSPTGWTSRAGRARRAALFAHDGATQNFVELEAGGKPAFTRLLTGDALRAVLVGGAAVQARRDRRGARAFRPTARPTASRARSRRTSPAPRSIAAAARAIAERSAHDDWAIDFAPYKLLEQSQLQLPNGRIDHSFVYEREHEKLGDGRIRFGSASPGTR